MTGRKLLLGVASGLAAGYAAYRTYEALRFRRAPERRRTDAADYARVRRSLEVAAALRAPLAFAGFAFGPAGDALDRATRTVPPWARTALFFFAASAGSAAIEFPISLVEDYRLEREFSLSDQTRAAWCVDYVKSSLISGAISALVAALLGAAVQRSPRFWPVLASLGTFPLFVAGNLLVPLYVMPLFNTFEPVTGPLEQRLRRLATRFGVGDAEILRMDMSRQTRKANAFVTGIGTTHRIVLGDTLIESFPEPEIEFVVAHELGHYINKDTWRLIGLGEVLAVILFLAANAGIARDEREEMRDRPLLVARLYALMLVTTQALRPWLFAFSRSREWASDRFAIAATGDAAAGAAAFVRLRDQNLADEDPPRWYEILFGSHPSLRARIAALENA